MSTTIEHVTRSCQFPDCDWETELLVEDGKAIEDFPVVNHYEQKHGGRVRVQVTVEEERIIGGRTIDKIHEDAHERFENEGHDVAFVRTEVFEEADDHSKLEGNQ